MKKKIEEEGRRKREEGRGRKEEGGRKREEGRRRKEEVAIALPPKTELSSVNPP